MQKSLVQLTRQHLRSQPRCSHAQRCISSNRTFEEGDTPLLRELTSSPRLKLLRKPLHRDGTISTHKGSIPHSAILGAKLNNIVKSSKGVKYMVGEASLGEYVTLSPRLVAPIYPDDASLIVNLLDLHPDPEGARIEVFECGTGHGALTLHLARAIHAANSGAGSEKKAMIHTMDISAKHSSHARKIVEGFRNGLYAQDVTFHVGTPADFFASRSHPQDDHAPEPSISHAILDMPSSHLSMPTVAPHIALGGKLILFTPSITQLIDAQRVVREQALPLYLDRVIELGSGMSGGREWSLKFVQSRASMRAAGGASSLRREAALAEEVEEAKAEGGAEVKGEEEEWVVSCRPKVGQVTQGGGFLGVWSRIEDRGVTGDVDTGFTKGMRGPVTASSGTIGDESSSEGDNDTSDEFDVVKSG